MTAIFRFVYDFVVTVVLFVIPVMRRRVITVVTEQKTWHIVVWHWRTQKSKDEIDKLVNILSRGVGTEQTIRFTFPFNGRPGTEGEFTFYMKKVIAVHII